MPAVVPVSLLDSGNPGFTRVAGLSQASVVKALSPDIRFPVSAHWVLADATDRAPPKAPGPAAAVAPWLVGLPLPVESVSTREVLVPMCHTPIYPLFHVATAFAWL